MRPALRGRRCIIGLTDTLVAFAREHELRLAEQPHFYEFTWQAQGTERYIRIDKRHGLVDAGTKRGDDYRTATSLGFLGARGRPLENLAYYREAAESATR